MERLALRYVERYATTRARLAAYLTRKIRERGWAEAREADTRALADRMATLGYVDDLSFAQARASAMNRRGLGSRRIDEALRFAGVEEAERGLLAPDLTEQAVESALTFARRRRLGPYAVERADRAALQRAMAAMIRAGHAPGLARRIVEMEPGEDVEPLRARDRY
ncbi:MAG: regulatory protein RecX [Pseudomonadota bacterium]